MNPDTLDCLFDVPGWHESGFLQVDAIHRLHWEQSGNPDGQPIVFLHGGPGGAFNEVILRYFNPQLYRLVYFHQRGAGRSEPLGELRNNTTAHLVDDIESLREHLAIDRWAVAGGSWGSALALAYAQQHPDRCTGLLVNGVFLARDSDLDWFFNASRPFFPEAWEAFVEFLPPTERKDLLAGYQRRIVSEDPAVYEPAVRAWSAFEGAIAVLEPDASVQQAFAEPRFALAYARMNVHYFSNDCFLGDTDLLAGVIRIQHLPAIIVHGRYDLVAPLTAARELAAAWPQAHLVTIPNAGHSRFEPATAAALIDAQASLHGLLPTDPA